MSFRVGIAGHRGYSGAELARLLSRHSQVEFVLLDHREPAADGARFLVTQDVERIPIDSIGSAALDLVFLATSAEVSLELVPKILEAGPRVIDLSGAFRLKTSER